MTQSTRRDVLAGALAVAGALGLAGSGEAAAEPVSGVVHGLDGALAGQGSTGEGIAGVLVSNGAEIVATDASGRWTLPAGPNRQIFVIKPAGWALPRDRRGLPDFYRDLDGEASSEVQFGLHPAREASRFSVALLADTQPQSLLELSYLRDCILPAVADTGAAFAINHGDVVFDAPALHARYTDLIAGTGMPWHHCPGNHDIDHGALPGPASFKTWRKTFGPAHYALQHGGATFILLNNVEPLPRGERTTSGHDYRGRIGQDQMAFVRRLLARVPRDQLVVVSMHIPLVAHESLDDPASVTEDRQELLRLLSGRPHTLSLAGHMHTTEHHYLGVDDGFQGPGLHHHHVLTAACGSWWSGPFDVEGQPLAASCDGTPKGFHVLDIDGSNFETRYVAPGHAGHPQMRVALDFHQGGGEGGDGDRATRCSGSLSRGQLPRTALAVNVFDGGPRTRVTCRVISPRQQGTGATGRTLELARTSAVDPATAETYCRHQQELKPWVRAARSSHLWRAPLPTDLTPGVYSALVTVSDEYGRQHQSRMMFEISA